MSKKACSLDTNIVSYMSEGEGKKKTIGVEIVDNEVVPKYLRSITLTIDGGSISGRRAARKIVADMLSERFSADA